MNRFIRKLVLSVSVIFTTASVYAYSACPVVAPVGSKVGMLLVALGVGYWILTLADKQNAPLDILGRIIGSLILLVAVAGLICTAVFGVCWLKDCKTDASTAYFHPGTKCPLGSKPGSDAKSMHPDTQ